MSIAFTKTIVSPTGTTVIPGQNIVYQISVTNNTGADTTFSFVDNLPVGTTFVSLKSDVSSSGGSGITSTIVVNSIGRVSVSSDNNLPAGLTTFYLLTVNVDQTAVVGSVIQNTVSNDTIAVSPPLTVVDPVADLSVSILGSPFGFLGGTNKFITTVTNIGPSDAVNVVLMEKINSASVKFTQLSGPPFTLPVVVPTIFSSTSTSIGTSCGESYTARTTIPVFLAGATATFLLSEQEEEKEKDHEVKDCCSKKSAKSRPASKLKVSAQVGSDTFDPNLVNNVDHADTHLNVVINVCCKE